MSNGIRNAAAAFALNEPAAAESAREFAFSDADFRDLAQYAYAVSHDLKTPLRGIHHYADFLREDLEADSLDLVELIMSLEEEFSKEGKTIEISDEDAEKIATVQDAVNYIKELGGIED